MKKFFYLSAIFAFAALLSSCNSDEDSYHMFSVDSDLGKTTYPDVFVDQSIDTLRIHTTDSFEANTNCDWLSFGETNSATISKKVNYAYGSIATFNLAIKFGVNNGDKARITYINFIANGRTTARGYKQWNCHNIFDPMPTFTDPETKTVAVFNKMVESTAPTDSIAFTLYDNATLSSDAEWLSAEQTTFAAGTHVVKLSIERNPTLAERAAKLTLRSENGGKSIINITQK